MRFICALSVATLTASLLSACATETVSQTDKKVINQQAAVANVQMGMAYLEQDKTVEAKQKFMLALQESPKLPSSWYAMAYFHEITGEPGLADQEYQKSIAIAPDSGEAHNNYGTFLCRTGRYNEAIGQFKLAIAEPKYMHDGSAYENAGICALQVPNKTLAYSLFQKALLNNPNLTNALLHFGQLSLEHKDYVTAKSCLDRYLELHKSNQDSDRLANQLARINTKQSKAKAGNHLINERFKLMKVKA